MKRVFYLLAVGALLWTGCATSSQKVETQETKATPQVPAQQAKPEPKKERIVLLQIPRVIKETALLSDGTADEIRTYSYSPDGKKVEREELVDSSSREVLETVEYVYKGEMIAERKVFDREKKLQGRRTYTYTPAGLVDTETFFDRKDKIQAISRYVYDAGGRKTEWATLDSAGSILATTKYVYSNDKLVKIILLGPTGKVDMEIAAVYDEKGNLIKETYSDAASKVEKETVYIYDEKNRLTTETTLSSTKSPMSSIVYEYSGDSKKAGKVLYRDGGGKIKKTALVEYAYREEKKTVYE